jgi:hypothetical protein
MNVTRAMNCEEAMDAYGKQMLESVPVCFDPYQHHHGVLETNRETWRTRANAKPLRVTRK